MKAQLVERARAGEARAVEALARAVAPRLLRLALRLGERGEEAEDLVQEALARGLSRLGRIREPRAAGKWFARILVNAWRDRGRRRWSGARRLESLASEPAAPSACEPEARAVSRETSQRVRAAIDALPPAQRAVLTLRVQEGFSVAETAEALASTPERVKANLWHARRALEGKLTDLLEARGPPRGSSSSSPGSSARWSTGPDSGSSSRRSSLRSRRSIAPIRAGGSTPKRWRRRRSRRCSWTLALGWSRARRRRESGSTPERATYAPRSATTRSTRPE